MRITICNLFAITSLLTAAAFSSLAQTQPSPKNNLHPPGTIDGSKTPEQIPDDVAYRLFFRAVSEPSNASPAQRERLRVKLLRAQLSDADLTPLVEALGNYHDGREAWERSYQQALSKSGALNASTVNAQFVAERDVLIKNTRDSIAARLSANGFIQLDRLVQMEKRNMVIAPFPEMPHNMNH